MLFCVAQKLWEDIGTLKRFYLIPVILCLVFPNDVHLISGFNFNAICTSE